MPQDTDGWLTLFIIASSAVLATAALLRLLAMLLLPGLDRWFRSRKPPYLSRRDRLVHAAWLTFCAV